MGTNYYAYGKPKEPCKECGRPHDEEVYHIGKGSGGWHFALHVIPEKGIHLLEDWVNFIVDNNLTIKNEYGNILSLGEFISHVAERGAPQLINKPLDWYAANHAEPGYNNLVRSKIDGVSCIRHSGGTWDYFAGDFS